MTDKKISALTAATTPLAGTEELPIVQGGSTVKVSVNNLTAGKPVSMTKLTASIPSGTAYHELLADGLLNWGASGYLFTSMQAATVTGSPGLYLGYNSSTKSGIIGPVAIGGAPNQGLEIWAFDNVSVFKQIGLFSAVTANAGFTLNIGNLTFGTAAKGINFTANTPAAGMTSQLLNWYEEGTWTPTFTNCGTASFTVAKYTRVGRIVNIQLVMLATSITANSSQFTLPIASSCLTSGTFTSGTLQGGFVEAQASTACYFATTMTGTVAPNVNLTYSV